MSSLIAFVLWMADADAGSAKTDYSVLCAVMCRSEWIIVDTVCTSWQGHVNRLTGQRPIETKTVFVAIHTSVTSRVL